MNLGEMREQGAVGMKPGKRGDNYRVSVLSFLASTGTPHTSLHHSSRPIYAFN